MNLKLIFFFLLLLVTSIACKREMATSPSLSSILKSPIGGEVVIKGSVNLVSKNLLNRKTLSANKIASIDLPLISATSGDKIGAVHIENNVFWKNTDKPGLSISGYADEFIMTPEWLGRLDVFHLGSLIRGNSIQDLSFVPLSERAGEYVSKPVYASVSFPSKTVSGSFMPDVMAASEFFGSLMQQNGLGSAQTSNFSYELREFSYYNEVKTVFGSNVDIKALFYKSQSSGSTTSDKISKKSGLIASFTQKNFSVDMDVPESGELLEDLNISALGGISPAYINSVVYGSKGVILIESDHDSETLKSTFNKAFSVIGGLISGSQNLTTQESQIISESDLQIFFIGPNGEQAIKKLSSFDELVNFVRTGSIFSPSSPGVPISFKMRALNNHQTIKNNFSIDILFKPFYIRGKFVLDPNRPDAPRHELHLSFFADRAATIPIEVPNGVPIYAETEFVRMQREGSPREGFTITPIFKAEAHYNMAQGNELVIKPVLLINHSSSSPDNSYYLVP